MGADALALSPRDNVATVLRPVAAGERIAIGGGAAGLTLIAAEAIPFCHKISLVALAAGEAVVKYGDAIGSMCAPVGAGRHVHVHNMRSNRGRQ